MRRILLALFIWLVTITSTPAHAQNSNPKFRDYPVRVFTGRKPALKLSKDDLTYRTRYRNLYNASPNFAGHYGVTVVGCGGGCIFLLAVDYKTGRTVSFDVEAGEDLTTCPDDYRDEAGDPVEKGFFFEPDSKLFVVAGQMPGLECGARYYFEKNGKLTKIREVALVKSR